MSIKEEQARRLAEFIHCGQKRRDGEDFIRHPERVAKAIRELGYDEDVRCAAWLHDAEDFPYLNILFSLIDRVLGDKVFGLVLVLTHTKGVAYNEYIEHITRYPEALAIKWEDIIDNTRNMNGKDNPVVNRQLEKYRSAVMFLKSKEIEIEIPEILKERLKVG